MCILKAGKIDPTDSSLVRFIHFLHAFCFQKTKSNKRRRKQCFGLEILNSRCIIKLFGFWSSSSSLHRTMTAGTIRRGQPTRCCPGQWNL